MSASYRSYTLRGRLMQMVNEPKSANSHGLRTSLDLYFEGFKLTVTLS